MKTLAYYYQFLTEAQRNATDAIFGYLLELAVKDFFNRPLVISPAGKVDLSAVIAGKVRRLEVKQNGGDFRTAGKGSSIIAYAVYVDINKTLAEQFGYVMPMTVFRECGNALNLIRSEKTDSAGHTKMSLQTLYNYKADDFHGKKAFKLADAWEESGAVTFKEFFKA